MRSTLWDSSKSADRGFRFWNVAGKSAVDGIRRVVVRSSVRLPCIAVCDECALGAVGSGTAGKRERALADVVRGLVRRQEFLPWAGLLGRCRADGREGRVLDRWELVGRVSAIGAGLPGSVGEIGRAHV